METRKRTHRALPLHESNNRATSNGTQRTGRRKGTRSPARWRVVVMRTCVVGTIALVPCSYIYVSHRLFAPSLPSIDSLAATANQSLERRKESIAFHPSSHVGTNRTKSGYFPRVMGYYFEGVNSSSFLGAERLDSDMILLYKPVGKIDATQAELRRHDALKDSKKYKHRQNDPFETEDCKAMYAWQKTTFVTCNLLMETDLSRLGETSMSRGDEPVRLMANGYWRDVWQHETTEDLTVLKTMRYMHDYTDRNYDRHRRDAVAMERLTASDYIMNIYGFCGNSGFFEFADGGSLDDMLWEKEDASDQWNSSEKVVVAQQVATGVAEMHNFIEEGRPAMAHTDITTSQFVYVSEEGIYKLNDFNRCRFLLWNDEKNKTCTYSVGNNPGTFRSPEEYDYAPQTEKVDVYSMGNVFYSMLTAEWPMEYVKPSSSARHRIRDGKRPEISAKIRNSTDPFDQTMLKAIDMCWIQDPKRRSTAREVQAYLVGRLRTLGIMPEAKVDMGESSR